MRLNFFAHHRLIQPLEPRISSAQLSVPADVDLIVIGQHGRRGLARLICGSTAEHVLKHAPCAVLVTAPEPASRA